MTISCKQKINSKSSTEAELIGIDDCIHHALWLRHFLLAQGYKRASKIVMLQDNQSAILLEQNGILSSTKRTKHINVRYFFIKNKIDIGEIEVKWCSTEKMVADYLTKPLTGERFKRLRARIMNTSYKPEIKIEGKTSDVEDKKQTTVTQVGKEIEAVKPNVEDKGVKHWFRMDKNKKCFLTTKAGGPKWNDVISRTTYDLDNGDMIEYIQIDETISDEFLHRKLPMGVKNVSTVLQYRSDSGEGVTDKIKTYIYHK